MALLDKLKSFLGLNEEVPEPIAPQIEEAPVFITENEPIAPFNAENEGILAKIRALPDDMVALDLVGRPLTSLAGAKLPSGLKFLDLSATKLQGLKGVKLPDGLEALYLYGTPLTTLEGIDWPKRLFTLGVDVSLLENTPADALPPTLSRLSLSSKEPTHLPENIRSLKNLKRLGLSDLKLTELPDWLPELGLPFARKSYGDGIRLYNTTVEGVDMSIFDQSQEAIHQWFEERRSQGETPLNEIKVVFLGNGDVGKTHTIARLLRNGEKPDDTFTGNSTPGIAISDKTYKIDGQDIRVHFWDFGGQDILYSMHRMFMTERTIYVVMVDARNESKGHQAREWLDTVKSFAGDAPVLLVINKTDQNPSVTVDENSLTGEYPNLKEVIYLSAKDFGKQEFNKRFTDAMLKLIRESEWPKKRWPKTWKKVKDALQNLKTPYIRSEDYEKICRECGLEKGDEALLNWCNDLGVCFCRQDFRLKDYVILRPEWITNAIYTILFNHRETVCNGMISLESIDALLRNDIKQPQIRRVKENICYSHQDTTYVLDVVRKFYLSYQVDQNTEFFPMLCSENSSTVVQEYAEQIDTLEFHMVFEYLPNNVLHRLMVERWRELDLNNVWRTGARFCSQNIGLSAVVKIDCEVLKIYVRSGNPLHPANTYLSFISGSVEHICEDLKLDILKKKLIYKVGSKKHSFDYDELLQMIADGIEIAYASSLDRPYRQPRIEDILKQLAPAKDRELEQIIEQEQLLADLVKLCAELQAEKLYWDSEEDDRNRYLRNGLHKMPYVVHDQTQRGISGGGHRAGELDLDIRKFKDIPWTICEALRVDGVEKTDWNGHLDKLMVNYNPNGLKFLILLTYVDDVNNRFDAIWRGFETHIQKYAPDGFEVVPNSFHHYTEGSWTDPQNIKTARCEYIRGDYQPTVYHIFVRMGR